MNLVPYTDPATGAVIQPTAQEIADNNTAVAQSEGVNKALAALKLSNPADFETVRRMPFADQAKHFGL